MEHTPMNQIQDRFQLETDLLRLEQQVEENNADLRQAKFDLREAKVAEAEYRGSFKSFRDKLAGRREETDTALRHAVQNAEATLASTQRQKELLDARLSEIKEQLSALPDWVSLRDGSREWERLEALYCLEVLTPLLETTRNLLVERRNQFNGANAGQIKSRQTLSEIYSAPEAAGEACKPYLLRLKAALEELGNSLELHSFFESPTFFLSSATQFTRMDRINTAITQAETLQRQLIKLQKELSE